jgi:hypothetical protein
MADKSELAKAVSEATGVDTNDKDILQVLDKEFGTDYSSEKPAYGVDFNVNPDNAISYMKNIAIKFGPTLAKYTLAKNPYGIFFAGRMNFGGKIENITIKPMAPRKFLAIKSGSVDPFHVNFGDIHGDTYVFDFDIENNTTIQNSVDDMYFNSLERLNGFVFQKMVALVNGAVIAEMRTAQRIILKALWDGKAQAFDATTLEKVNIQTLTAGTKPSAKDLANAMKKFERRMRYFDTKYNSLGWAQGTAVDELLTLVSGDTATNIEMELGLNAFQGNILYDDVVERRIFPDWPALRLTNAEHTVTSADVSGDEPLLDPRQYPINTVLPVGFVVPDGATWSEAFTAIPEGALPLTVWDKDFFKLFDVILRNTPFLQIKQIEGTRYSQIYLNQKTYMTITDVLNNAFVIDTSVFPEATKK